MRDIRFNPRMVIAATVCLMVMGIAGCGDDKPNNNDTTPPTVDSTAPAGAATLVDISANITAEFSEAMTASTISATTFTLKQGATAVAGTVTYSSNPGATFNPSNNLLPNTVYTATITTGAEDLAGNGLASNYVWTFTTAPTPDNVRPTVASTAPADGAINVSVNGVVTATFSEPVNPATVTASSFLLIRVATPVAGIVTYAGNTATFTPSNPLVENATYAATITTAVADLSGNLLAAAYVWGFTTESTTDITPPTVLSTVPASASTNVAVSANVSASFSETMNAATIGTATFTLRQGATPVAGAVTYAGTTATFNPTSDLAFNTSYTATLTTGAADLAGNALAAQATWTFTTAAAADATPPTVVTVIPASGALNIAVNTNVTATFSEAMNASSISTTSFILMQGATHVNGTVSYAENTLTFNPSEDLGGGAVLTATILTAAEDLAGNNLAANFVWTFTTAPDVTPPTVVTVTPAGGAVSVAVSTSVTAAFSEGMNPATISTSSFTLMQGATPVNGTVSYTAGNTLTFNPSGDLAGSAVFTATILTAVEDLAGNNLAANFVWTFTTALAPDLTPPTVATTVPVNGATSVAISAAVTATFSENMNPLTVSGSTFTLMQGVTPVAGVVGYSGTTASISPTVALASQVVYTATITTGVTDLAGNAMASNYVWSFTTEGPVDTALPTVISVSPNDEEVNVVTAETITATFSEAMNPATISTSTFTLISGTGLVSGVVTYSGTTATFTPSAALSLSTLYAATITTGATDIGGDALAGDFAWVFTTEAVPEVTGIVPAANGFNVPINSKVAASFSKPMNAFTLTASSFVVRQGATVISGSVSTVGATAVFDPSSNLAPNTIYTATITTAATDLSGYTLAHDEVWSFTTGSNVDVTALIVTATDPDNDETNVPLSGTVRAFFSDAMDPTTLTTATFTVTSGSGQAVGTVTSSGTVATFTPSVPLAASTVYTATVTTGVADISGNALAEQKVWTFTTAP